MFAKIPKNIELIIKSFKQLNSFSKKVLKYGIIISTLIYLAGATLTFVNIYIIEFNFYNDFLSKLIMKNSFLILAQVIIGALFADFICARN